jgi:hypothetical protein
MSWGEKPSKTQVLSFVTGCASNSKNFVPHNSFISILEKQNTIWDVDPPLTCASVRKIFLDFKIKLKIQLNFYVKKIIKIRE